MTRPLASTRASQQGMVLFISLIALVALALGALAMFRGSMSATLVATNVASRQAALSFADTGVQLATTDIAARSLGASINADAQNSGYFSAIPAAEPDWTDPAIWTCANNAACPTPAQLCGGDAACIANTTGYTVLYKVHRMCTQANTAYNGTGATGVANICSLTFPSGTDRCGPGTSCAADPGKPSGGKPKVYFRITTRVDGPRNTRTVTQTVVGLQT
jgi:type IV pilus assembly protein PilX